MNTQNGIVLNELGTLEIQELELDDIDEPDHLQAIDPDRKP